MAQSHVMSALIDCFSLFRALAHNQYTTLIITLIDG